jgi:hypothetical protein
MKTVTETYTVYSIEELRENFEEGYRIAKETTRDFLDDVWADCMAAEVLEDALRARGITSIKINEFNIHGDLIKIEGYLPIPEDLQIAYYLAGGEPVTELKIGRFNGWTDWRYHVELDGDDLATEHLGLAVEEIMYDLERELFALACESRRHYINLESVIDHANEFELLFHSDGRPFNG